MKKLNREKVIRMVGSEINNRIGISSSGGSGGGGLAGAATQAWVGANYVSIEFFDRLFKAYDANGNEVLPNDTETVIDNIKAMFGFWTEQYVSALGQGTGGGGGGASALSDLLDVEINNPTNGQSLVYDSALSKWVNAAGGGVDMETVWRYLGQSSTQQIDISHLTTALSGYALKSGNVATATKLQTARTIWGQNFDGTDNVDGKLTISSDPYTSGVKNSLLNILINGKHDYGVAMKIHSYGDDAPCLRFSHSNNADDINSQINDNWSVGMQQSSYNNFAITQNRGTTGWGNIRLLIDNSGNVGINTTSPSYKLHANGTFYASGNSSIGGTLGVSGLLTASGGITIPSGKTLTIGDAVLSWDSTAQGIKITKGLYSETFISALGQGTGGGGGGASALSDLLDVEINNPINGQALIYNSTLGKWVNATGSGVDMETVWRYLAQSSTQQIDISHLTTALSGYALTSQLPTKNSWNYDDVYVKLSGSTITGRIVRAGGGEWIKGRDYAVVFGSSYGQAAGNSWNTVWSQKTTNGAWTAGNLSGDNYLRLVYDTDANYNVGNNQATYTITFPQASGTVALTGQIPDVSNFITNGGWITVNNDGLYVNGSNGWLRTYGNCGWYSQSHGGGWYMEDDTWIRSYNGKYVYISSNLASEHIYAGGGRANFDYALYINGVGYASTGLYSAGYVTALSDERKKDVVGDVNLTVEQIAKMPAVVYRWNDGREDDGSHVGSIAQDWQRVLPEVVMKANDDEGTLSMQYGVAALVSSIITARKVVDHERRIAELERENKELKLKLKIV